MTILYPPVLENKASAITSIDGNLNVYFTLPDNINRTDFKHIQVSLKFQATGACAASSRFTPDQATLFLDAIVDNNYFTLVEATTQLYKLTIPYKCFKDGAPYPGYTYLLQIRFGRNALWTNAVLTAGEWADQFANFANWRQNQANLVPSGFGEWSNSQSIYCTKGYTNELTYNLMNFVPELNWEFDTQDENDTISQVKLVYQYDILNGTNTKTITKTLLANGTIAQDKKYNCNIQLPIVALTPIYCSLEAVTKNNVLVTNTITIPSILSGIGIELNTTKPFDIVVLSGEEINDGIISKKFDFKNWQRDYDDTVEWDNYVAYYSTIDWDKYTTDILYKRNVDTMLDNYHLLSMRANIKYYNLYRINLFDFNTIQIYKQLQDNFGDDFTFKDYTVQMGDEYLYILTGVTYDNRVIAFTPILPYNEHNTGYGRLMNMEVSFLTTRRHQLRLHGDVKISSFKRNTSDQFQDTIGGKYPFYARFSEKNYRSLSLSALVTINFDPTSAFLRLDNDTGLWWDDDNENTLLVRDTDLFVHNEISLSRKRYKQLKSEAETIVDLSQNLENRNDYDYIYVPDGLNGPRSIYDTHLYKMDNMDLNVDPTDINIFKERQFRDKVMSWLSDGKPKLFRSETEGNMIVMISGVSFSPLAASGRMLYSFTCTLTEIADYNIENLIEYDLVPTEFTTNYSSTNEFDFNPGVEDPYIDNELYVLETSNLIIPLTMASVGINSIYLGDYIANGTGVYEYTIVGSENFPVGITLNRNTGIISGIPTIATADNVVTIQVEEVNGLRRKTTLQVKCEGVYDKLMFINTRGDWDYMTHINLINVGETITPIDITPYFTGGFTTASSGLKYKAAGLPYGLSIDPITGIISGQIKSVVGTGTAIVMAEDNLGNIATSLELVYDGALPRLYIEALSDFYIGDNFEGDSQPEINFSTGVRGGSGPYIYSAVDLPVGLRLDALTGVLSGTFDAAAVGPPSNCIITVTDSEGTSADLVVNIGTIYPKLTFAPLPQDDATGFPGLYAIGQTMHCGDVLPVIDLTPFVTGGMPYATAPNYRWSQINLWPNFELRTDGTIVTNGTVSVPSGPKIATITVYDQYGHTATQTLNIGQIISGISYNGISEVEYPSTNVAKTPQYAYHFENSVRIESGNFSIPATAFSGGGMTDPLNELNVYVNSLPFTVTKNAATNSFDFTPITQTAPQDKISNYIIFELPGVGNAVVLATVGKVYGPISWSGASPVLSEYTVNKTITTAIYPNLTTENGIVGGNPGSTGYNIISGGNFHGLTASVVQYNGKYGLKIAGTPTSENNPAIGDTWRVVIADADDERYSIELVSSGWTIPRIYPELILTCNFTTSQGDFTFVNGKTTFPDYDTLSDPTYATEVAKVKVLEATGGKEPYTYYIEGDDYYADVARGFTLRTMAEDKTSPNPKMIGMFVPTAADHTLHTTGSRKDLTAKLRVRDALGNIADVSNTGNWYTAKCIDEITSKAPAGSGDSPTNRWDLGYKLYAHGGIGYDFTQPILEMRGLNIPQVNATLTEGDTVIFDLRGGSKETLYGKSDTKSDIPVPITVHATRTSNNEWTLDYAFDLYMQLAGWVNKLAGDYINLGTIKMISAGVNFLVCLDDVVSIKDPDFTSGARTGQPFDVGGVMGYDWQVTNLPTGCQIYDPISGTYITGNTYHGQSCWIGGTVPVGLSDWEFDLTIIDGIGDTLTFTPKFKGSVLPLSFSPNTAPYRIIDRYIGNNYIAPQGAGFFNGYGNVSLRISGADPVTGIYDYFGNEMVVNGTNIEVSVTTPRLTAGYIVIIASDETINGTDICTYSLPVDLFYNLPSHADGTIVYDAASPSLALYNISIGTLNGYPPETTYTYIPADDVSTAVLTTYGLELTRIGGTEIVHLLSYLYHQSNVAVMPSITIQGQDNKANIFSFNLTLSIPLYQENIIITAATFTELDLDTTRWTGDHDYIHSYVEDPTSLAFLADANLKLDGNKLVKIDETLPISIPANPIKMNIVSGTDTYAFTITIV